MHSYLCRGQEMVECDCYVSTINLPNKFLSVAVAPNSKVGIDEYRNLLRPSLNWRRRPSHTWPMTDQEIGRGIQRYSDMYMGISGNPIADLRDYISSRAILVALGVGGRWWNILGYKKKPKLAPAQLIGGIGEAVTGHWLERIRGLTYILRPVGTSTDGIFQDQSGIWGPIEVKSTVRSRKRGQEQALTASRGLMRLYAHHELSGRTQSQARIGLALSIGVLVRQQIEVYCIEFVR